MKRTTPLLMALLLAAVPALLPAQATLVHSDSAAIVTARAFVLDTMAQLKAPGASITVIRDGVMIWSEGFGFADLEQRVPVTPLTRFRIGSVSKPLTSIALGLLVEEGKLDLDTPVQRYLPDFPVKQWPITTRQVAGHLAGIRHYRGDEFASARHYDTVRGGLAIFADDSLLFEPGTQYSYSTYGWNLISAVIESAGGESFLPYMARRVFGPAGMTRTVPEFNDSIIPFRARFYVHADSAAPATNAPYVDNSYKWAGGGFMATPVDLVNMVRSLLNHQLLNERTVELLFTDQKLENGTSTHVGIAWRINETKQGVKFIHHGGLIDGGRTFVFFYPESGYIFAITANTSSARLNIDEAATILGYFLPNK